MGAVSGAALGHKELLVDAITSGAGAVIGEVVAENLVDRDQVAREALLETQRKGQSFDPEVYKVAYRKKLQPYVNIGQLVAGSVIAATGRDPSLGIASAKNALENNFVLVDDAALIAAATLAVSLGLIEQAINGETRAKQIKNYFGNDEEEAQQEQTANSTGNTSGTTPPEDLEPGKEKNPQTEREPRSLQDKMALEAAKRGEGKRIMEELNDPNFKGMEKWQYKVKSSSGKDSVVHYVRDPKSGRLMDFKFKRNSVD